MSPMVDLLSNKPRVLHTVIITKQFCIVHAYQAHYDTIHPNIRVWTWSERPQINGEILSRGKFLSL